MIEENKWDEMNVYVCVAGLYILVVCLPLKEIRAINISDHLWVEMWCSAKRKQQNPKRETRERKK